MKNPILAGFVAGILSAVTGTTIMVTSYYLGYIETDLPTNSVIVTHMMVNTIYGIIFGVIYSKLYNTIPGKGLWKGLVYGLLLFLLSNIFAISYYTVSLNYPAGAGWVGGIYVLLVYGLILGALYKK